jgi:DNA modification methylase
LKQKRDRYEMHKYWGKKPSSDLKELLDQFSNPGDTVFDPFSGYGVFGCEAYILNRNVILNDLNPLANFLNKQLLETKVDIGLLIKQWKKIKLELEPYIKKWYQCTINGLNAELLTILRDSSNVPLKAKYKINGTGKSFEYEFTEVEKNDYLKFEQNYQIQDWYPENELIPNSRISAKKGMTVADLFTKRTLACHARLFALIEKYTNGNECNLFKIAFTANLANCSKLVPPIKSRGDMSQGAWMTGFYVGETYLENNVLAYFENRFEKIIKGKQDYLNQIGSGAELNFNQITYNNFYRILHNDAKNLDLDNESVDYIFTDPPYGDAVPYFEQSVIWNSWLKLTPDYENEIVISDSKIRNKGTEIFENDIQKAFAEIRRVLKTNKFFSLTYHSLSGLEWKAITNACLENGFELYDFKWLVQKSFTPRQINRLKSIKGDVLVTFRKCATINIPDKKSDLEIRNLFISKIKNWLEEKPLDTNEIFLRIMQMVFSEKIVIGNVDLLDLLVKNFKMSENKEWELNDKLELCRIG